MRATIQLSQYSNCSLCRIVAHLRRSAFPDSIDQPIPDNFLPTHQQIHMMGLIQLLNNTANLLNLLLAELGVVVVLVEVDGELFVFEGV